MSSKLEAQSLNYANKTVVYLPAGYVISQLSGLGSSGVVRTTIANACSSNPAAMADFYRITFGMSAQIESKIKPAWFANIGYRRPSDQPIQSVSVVVPVGTVRLGIGYFQKFSAERLIDPIEIKTVLYPEGTGEYIKTYQHAIIDALTGMASVGYRGVLNATDRIDIGIAVRHNRLDYREVLGESEMSSSLARYYSWGFGLRYKLPIDDSHKIYLGVMFEQGTVLIGEVQFKSTPMEGFEYHVIGRAPSRLSNGLGVVLSDKFAVSCGYSSVGWKNVREDMSDQLEYYTSLEYSYHTDRQFTFGIYSTGARFNSHILPEDDLRAVYLLLGLVAKVGIIEFDLVVADSHLISGDWHKSTILKMGVGFRR